MKKTIILIILSVLVVSGCNEEEIINISDPSSQIFDEAITNAADLQNLVNGVYSGLWEEPLVYTRHANTLQTLDARTDDATITANGVGFQDMGPLTTYINDADNGLTRRIWLNHYIAIRRANEVLRLIKIIEDPELTEERKNIMKGQVEFLRGFSYYRLILFFGENIPLITDNATTFDQLIVPGAADGEIWRQVETDLENAETLLPESWSGDDKGRATKGAAVGILGKAYMQRGLYDQALTQFEKIINGEVGSYSLVEDYRDNHTEENEFNEESIFEIQMAPNGSQGGQWFAYSQNAGIGRWFNIEASQELLEVFQNDNAGDPRYHMTFYAPDGAYRIDGEDTIDYDFDLTAGSRTSGIITVRKWDNEVAAQSLSRDGVNYRLLRYADVLLSAAECALEEGDETKAKNYISLVRQRANNIVDEQPQLYFSKEYEGTMPAGFPIETDVDVWMADKGWDLRQVIMNERRMEFSFEQSRYWDLIRWDAAGWIDITEYITDASFTREKLLLPIPRAELSANPKLQGNSAN